MSTSLISYHLPIGCHDKMAISIAFTTSLHQFQSYQYHHRYYYSDKPISLHYYLLSVKIDALYNMYTQIILRLLILSIDDLFNE